MVTAVLRHASRARWDALLVMLALAHGWLLIALPSAPLIAVAMWWNANTISHNFIHRPIFRSPVANAVFSLYLTLVLGFPQSFWRARHLAHHGLRDQGRLKVQPLDVIGAIALWGMLLFFAPDFALDVYIPGFAIGLALCFLHGHYEHARGTTSHYGALYNLLFFNDGYHVEHHLHPGVHWRELPAERTAEANASRWPAVLRWLECFNLCALEGLVLRSVLLRRFVINRHERAMRRLRIDFSSLRRAAIVGGGLFPRTAIILDRLIPQASITIIDMSADNIAAARQFIQNKVQCLEQRFDSNAECDCDLLVIPLAFKGDRETIYKRPPARFVLVHDWIWRRRGESVIVSYLLLKRINLVRQ